MPKPRIKPGQVYEILDLPHGRYYGAIGAGGDVVFFDLVRVEPAPDQTIIAGAHILFRLPVNHPTIRRAGWRFLGDVPLEGALAEYGRYVHGDASGNIVSIYDNENGALTEQPSQRAMGLERFSVWDAANHISPILRQHFCGVPTHLSKGIRSPRFRRI